MGIWVLFEEEKWKKTVILNIVYYGFQEIYPPKFCIVDNLWEWSCLYKSESKCMSFENPVWACSVIYVCCHLLIKLMSPPGGYHWSLLHCIMIANGCPLYYCQVQHTTGIYLFLYFILLRALSVSSFTFALIHSRGICYQLHEYWLTNRPSQFNI